MTRLAVQHDVINLAQGFPKFAAPDFLKDAACEAIQSDVNQYAITWGSPAFRGAISGKYRRFYDFDVDPESEVTVACGATECMIASMLALVDPGERVLVFEPFYENYGPDSIIASATPLYAPLYAERDWAVDGAELESIIRGTLDEGESEPSSSTRPTTPLERCSPRPSFWSWPIWPSGMTSW